MSKDHKPDDKEELNRITKAGGSVTYGRVNGNLNLSRAFGDLEYKQNKSLGPEEQMITANPDISKVKN
jgi:serine/threonine protein phosphatase PrpC